ncbi:pantothenate kinase [Tenacibaculum holothuriorum]|uniref:Type III pantothenate kinase n=1 Tax=Tenacibaculum holothuriorum TaxID=1635173 RepID=A0A1Y2P9T6_9FLAO|nr:type III pantothenate kinase [Tenacibaculum holothuriorum]OSY87202.1 pantothenate kinase [Tenacibaculum holothuriorum]
MKLIIDLGNTRVKVAVFEEDNLEQFFVFSKEEFLEKIKSFSFKKKITHCIVSSVGNLSIEEEKEIRELYNPIFLTNQTKVPFTNLYKTPKTLGVDRIALASAAIQKYSKQNVLVIDAGTCITFDFISKQDEYLGGAISPGIQMRYKALHNFTAKLPLLESGEFTDFIGFDTESSMHSGVLNGVCNEIDGVINQYSKKFQDLTVVLTGGDTNFLAKQLKSVIFAHPNFVLEGLHTILNYNLAND